MMRENKLIEQVRALAEAQKRHNALIVELRDNNIPSIRVAAQMAFASVFAKQVDFTALLAALERAERIEQRAHTLVVMLSVTDLPFQIDERVDALVVALSEPQ